MGVPKAMLPFGPELLIQRVVRLLGQAAHPIIVVAARRQVLPPLPKTVQVVRDHREGRGPLEGICAGLEAIQGRCEAAYLTACDVPTLVPAFVQALTGRLVGHRIAVPVDSPYFHPLAAVYRADVLPDVQALLQRDRLRPVDLFETVDTCRVPVDELRAADPELNSLENLNRPDDYFAALTKAGFALDEDIRRALRAASD
jgi:molybdopterin-guanine dinucleotide biosynthesis protein A